MPSNTPANPTAGDDVDEHVPHGTKGATQIARAVLGVQREAARKTLLFAQRSYS